MTALAGLIEAAGHECERRAGSYPKKIRSGANAETLSIDYQAWIAIKVWLETDRFYSFAGGTDAQRADAPIVSWPELELAAEKALVSIDAKVTALEAGGDAAKLADAQLRRARLTAIHRKVQLRRQSIDEINRQLREQRQEIAA